MPQPPEPALRQCSHNLPADFASSAISRTLQQKLHSPQAFPGIASMNFSLAIDSDSIVHLFIAEGAGAREIEMSLKDLSPVRPSAAFPIISRRAAFRRKRRSPPLPARCGGVRPRGSRGG